MMLLLDFAVACVDCTGGNKKKKKKKNTETGSITILTESTSRSIKISTNKSHIQSAAQQMFTCSFTH